MNKKCNWYKVKIEQTIQINVVMNFRNIGNQYFKQHKMHHMILIKAAILMCCCVFITCGWTPSFCSDYQFKRKKQHQREKRRMSLLVWLIHNLPFLYFNLSNNKVTAQKQNGTSGGEWYKVKKTWLIEQLSH